MLPVRPPIQPMLAKLREEIPEDDGWLYEPKWDGFRGIVFRDGPDVHIASRDGRVLERYFPELVPALREALPERCVVDGEVVIGGPAGLDFDALQLRIHPAESRIKLLAAQRPSSFVAFDLLALDQDNVMDQPFSARRGRLEAALETAPVAGRDTITTDPGGQVMLTPQTADPAEARTWFEELEDVGLDGVIAKRADLPYRPGDRVMVKVKHRRTADCVVGGYRLSKGGDGVGSLLLGVYDAAGSLQYVGHTSSFKAAERRSLLEELRPLEGGSSFGAGRSPGGPSRWTGGKDPSWVALDPVLVCEVSYDHMQGQRFRHAARFLRWRTDKPPRECTTDQLSRG